MKRLLLTVLGSFVLLWAVARHYDLTAQRISTANGLPTNIVSRIWQTADGYMWFETRSGLCRYDGYEVQLLEPSAVPSPSNASALKTSEAEWRRDGKGRLTRLGADGSRRSWHLIAEDIIAYTRADHFHVADVDGQTEAISTYGGGLYFYDKPTGELTCIADGVIDTPYLTGLFVDSTGCIWVIEDYLGIKCLRMNKLSYKRLALVRQSAIQDANYIRCLAPLDGDRLLCSNQTGDLYAYDVQTAQSTFIQHIRSRVYTVLVDRHGTRWMGTRGEGLFRDGRMVEGLPSPNVFCIKEADNGTLWVATLGGGVAHLQLDGTVEDTLLQGHNCHDIVADRQGRWWVAAEDALYIIEGGHAEPVQTGYFVCLFLADNGTLWAGSIGDGLQNCENGQRYDKRSGLASNNIYAMTADGDGRLWIGTEEGLSCLNPQTGDVLNYSFTENSLANVFSERAALRLADGRLLFGTHNGLIAVEPQPIAAEPQPVRTTITALLVNGTAEHSGSRLTYKDNNLTFRFSNFEYARQASVIYQYRLDGIDHDWCQPVKEHSAVYRNLPPGRYTFRVRSGNGTGHWSDEATMNIHILQPWWNTWWAWGLYLLVAVAVSIGIGRLLLLRRQLDVERQVAAFKMDFYDRIARELRNPVNILQGAAENVQLSGTTKTTVQSLRRGSRRMLKLMDMLQQFNKSHAPTDEVLEQHFQQIVDAIHEEEEFRELAPPPINDCTILIAEDDEDSLTHLTDTLNPYFHVVGCRSADECEAIAVQQQPAVVLMDTTSNEKACCELTRRLVEKLPATAVIHLSSYSDHELRSLHSGAADYVVKPFSGKVLVEKIKRLIKPSATSATQTLPQPNVQSEVLTDLKDKRFLDRFRTILDTHVSDENFSVEQFASLMNLGRSHFYKRVKTLTGETPVQHLHRARLAYAARLLRESSMTVEEVMSRSGFHNSTHFYNAFKKQFGMSPNSLRQTEKE